MGHCAWCRGRFSLGAFCASFILLLKISRSSSRSLKPSGGALRLEAGRTAGMVRFWSRSCGLVSFSAVWGAGKAGGEGDGFVVGEMERKGK